MPSYRYDFFHVKGFVRSKATLVICPASLLSQWEGEVNRRVKSGAMRVHVYHGTSRGQSAKALANYDLVVTTYGTVMSEMKGIFGGKEEQKRSLDDLQPLTEEALENGEQET